MHIGQTLKETSHGFNEWIYKHLGLLSKSKILLCSTFLIWIVTLIDKHKSWFTPSIYLPSALVLALLVALNLVFSLHCSIFSDLQSWTSQVNPLRITHKHTKINTSSYNDMDIYNLVYNLPWSKACLVT